MSKRRLLVPVHDYVPSKGTGRCDWSDGRRYCGLPRDNRHHTETRADQSLQLADDEAQAVLGLDG